MFIINFIRDFGLIRSFLIVFFILNLTTYRLFWLDKSYAINGSRRIKETRLIFSTLFLGGFGAAIAMSQLRHKTNKPKFKIARFFGILIAIIPMIHVVEGVTRGQTVQFVEIDFVSTNWPPNLDGYRIAFMTDLHDISVEDMTTIIDKLNDRSIDLLLLGGDFADYWRTGPHYRSTIGAISLAQTTDGIFGVEGNHDNHKKLFDAMNYYGITYLDNTGYEIREGFFLGGVEDLRNRQPDIAAAMYQSNHGDFRLLVTHNPDASMKQETVGIDLILAGHTHGGQITIFGFPIVLTLNLISEYGTRFSHGFSTSADGVPVFTSRGAGSYYNWPRIFAQPEVVIFTLYSDIFYN